MKKHFALLVFSLFFNYNAKSQNTMETYYSNATLFPYTNMLMNDKSPKVLQRFEYDYFFMKGKDTLKIMILEALNDFQFIKIGDINKGNELFVIDKVIQDWQDRTWENNYQNKQVVSHHFMNSKGYEIDFTVGGMNLTDTFVRFESIRGQYMNFAEIAPFPTLSIPLSIGKEWSFSIRAGQFNRHPLIGMWEGNLAVPASYNVLSQSQRNINNKNYHCWNIASQANTRIGTTFLNFEYCENYGLTELNYKFLNELSMKMIVNKLP